MKCLQQLCISSTPLWFIFKAKPHALLTVGQAAKTRSGCNFEYFCLFFICAVKGLVRSGWERESMSLPNPALVQPQSDLALVSKCSSEQVNDGCFGREEWDCCAEVLKILIPNLDTSVDWNGLHAWLTAELKLVLLGKGLSVWCLFLLLPCAACFPSL